MRTFIAIALGEGIQAQVKGVLLDVGRWCPRARTVRIDNIHLTLAFLGEVPDARIPDIDEAISQASLQSTPHELVLRGSGTFGPVAHPKVLWVGVDGDTAPLFALQKKLALELFKRGFDPDHAVYSPHVTLARAKHPRGDQDLARAAEALRERALGAELVREVVLFESRADQGGMHHVALSRHTLPGCRTRNSTF